MINLTQRCGRPLNYTTIINEYVYSICILAYVKLQCILSNLITVLYGESKVSTRVLDCERD